jgi:hypothetical protein
MAFRFVLCIDTPLRDRFESQLPGSRQGFMNDTQRCLPYTVPSGMAFGAVNTTNPHRVHMSCECPIQ